MSSSRFTLLTALRLLMLLVACCAGAAQADVYGDVRQMLRDGKRAEAMSSAQSYITAHPQDPQMRFLLGVMQSEAGQSEQALQTFTLLTQEYPELPEPYNNLAVLLGRLGQYDKAQEALSMAIRNNPDYATANENLGDVYSKLAAQAYSRSLQLDASNTAIAPKLALLRQLLTPVPAVKPAPSP